MESLFYPKWYCEAHNNFKIDIAAIKKGRLEISYSIVYDQWTDTAALDISSFLPEQVMIEVIKSFKRNFKF